MERSEAINELATALSKAQGAYGTIKKTGRNPMFKSQYSTFDDMMTAVRKPLADNGLAFSQMLGSLDGEPALTSMIMHASGQWIADTVQMIVLSGNKGTNEVQVFGSALTYMKRYAGGSMLGVGGDNDDDGNSAGKPVEQPAPAPTQAEPHWIEDDTTRKKFWAHWTAQGLSNDDVHKALAVEHINTFDGDKKAAVDKINHWVENKMLLQEVSEVMDADTDDLPY